MAWLLANYGIIAAALLGVSEVLAQIPSIQSNSIFQLVVSGLKTLTAKK